MNAVVDELRTRLASLDFCDVVYTVHCSDGLGYPNGAERYRRQRTYQLMKKLPIYSASPAKKEFKERLVELLSAHGAVLHSDLLNGIHSDEFVTGPYEIITSKFAQQREQLFEEYQVNSVAALFIKYPDDDFIGGMELLSDLPQTELFERVQQPGVKELLKLTHFYLTRTYPELLNPHVPCGKLNKKALQVIRLISQGLSTNEIAKETHMTERGVSYYIDRLVTSFGAQNRTEVVRIAKEKCII